MDTHWRIGTYQEGGRGKVMRRFVARPCNYVQIIVLVPTAALQHATGQARCYSLTTI